MKTRLLIFTIVFFITSQLFSQTIPDNFNSRITWIKQILLEFPNSNMTGFTRFNVYDYQLLEDIYEGEKLRGFQGFQIGLKNNGNAAIGEAINFFNYQSYESVIREIRVNVLRGEYFTALENAGFSFIEKRNEIVEYVLFDEMIIPLITVIVTDRIRDVGLIGIDITWERWSNEERNQFRRMIYLSAR
ncbi:MAG: hypothetical protein LBG94_03935 [Treponema sp.]|jgi:hypothetical protein|nr:hypothetical protein [Treponema sp.]